jgi:hypothetical protein
VTDDAGLLHDGDEPAHRCDLPKPPVYWHPETQTATARSEERVNAVAACPRCGALWVTRPHPESLTRTRWVPLRWWHRQVRRNLRAQEDGQ